jgi:oligopeptide transport system permease protein
MSERPDSPAGDPQGPVGAGSLGGAGTATAVAGGDLPGRQASLWGDAVRQLRRKPLFLLAFAFILVMIVMAAFPSLFTGTDPRDCDLSRSLQPPGSGAVFGYDVQGCDYHARVVYGARVSVVIGVVVALGAAGIGSLLGAVAGYYGGVVDMLVARFTDIWFGIPIVLGSIIVLEAFTRRGLFSVSLALIVLGWPTFMRLMRSAVLSSKSQDYVQAARALGASDWRIITTHIVPNSLAPVVVYATITIGVMIAAEATLSFLGVGLQLPAISWGLMISDSQRLILQAPHLLLFPGLSLSLTVLAFILMGDALRDALDPKLR